MATVPLREDHPPAATDLETAPPRRRTTLLLPGALAIAAGLVIAPFEGGFRETTWYPVALFLMALTALVLVVAPPARIGRSRPFELALGAFVLFMLWTFLSIAWGAVPGNAWDAGNRALLFALAFALAGLRPWPAGAARAALWLVAGGLGAIAVGVLVATATKAHPIEMFLQGRLSEPVGYANATAGLFLLGVFPAIHLATAREERWPLRGLALALATVLLSTALLTQSRGGVIAFAATAAIFLVLHPRRWVALAAVLVPAAMVAIGWSALTDVRNAESAGQLDDALADARGAVILGALVAFALGAAAAFGARRLPRLSTGSEGARRRGERVFLALAALMALGGAVFVLASPGWLDERWEEFKNTGYERVESDETRFGGALGSSRYDFYRVAVDEWKDHPLAGNGAESFAVPYLQERRTAESPRYAHSLPFEVLSGLGAIGLVLLALFVVAAIAGFSAARRRAGEAEAGIAVAAFAGFSVWFVHGLVDWLWQFAALSLIAMALLGLAMRTTGSRATLAGGDVGTPPRSIPLRVALAVVVLLAAVSLALPGAAARYERAAFERQATDRAGALDRLERAAELDRLSASPLIAHAVLARAGGNAEEARANLVDAVDREPENWFAHFELALQDGAARRYDAAKRSIDAARRLNPQQPLVAEVQEAIRARRMIDPGKIERALREQLSIRLRPFESE
ncbi:MAG TPA: O-antigen ligase family protein [Solirubrobacteraceae bacterium]